jgi:hypothetical protein
MHIIYLEGWGNNCCNGLAGWPKSQDGQGRCDPSQEMHDGMTISPEWSFWWSGIAEDEIARVATWVISERLA